MEKSIGEISGSTSTAVHARCLLCDKLVSKAADNVSHVEKRILDLDGFESLSTLKGAGSPTQETVVNRKPQTASEKRQAAKLTKEFKETVKMNSELAVMRCSVNLPPIDVRIYILVCNALVYLMKIGQYY